VIGVVGPVILLGVDAAVAAQRHARGRLHGSAEEARGQRAPSRLRRGRARPQRSAASKKQQETARNSYHTTQSAGRTFKY
jgi:hypothetical protein